LYHLFSEYLKEREQEPPSLFGWTIAFIFGITALAVVAPYVTVVAFPVGLSLLVFHSVSRRRKAAERENQGRLETAEWFLMLYRFRREKQLESRSFPDVIPELEACAKLRHSILQTLNSKEWRELASAQGWRDLESLCKSVAEDLMIDAIWSAKPLFREIGGRRSTFERKCADTAYSARPMTAVKLARAQLERLLDDVSDFPLASLRSTDALARAQIELESIRQAEIEIHGSG
jgi:hypothetical protein